MLILGLSWRAIKANSSGRGWAFGLNVLFRRGFGGEKAGNVLVFEVIEREMDEMLDHLLGDPRDYPVH